MNTVTLPYWVARLLVDAATEHLDHVEALEDSERRLGAHDERIAT